MKILVIDDDQTVLQALKILLSSRQYAVDVATDGEMGLQMADAFDYDLILLDILLPQLDGISLCQKLRAKGFRSPILLLTGQNEEGSQKAIALNAGADDYVVKPFDSDELIARVQALLRRGGSIAEPILSWGNLLVNPSNCQVIYGTDLISVSPKKYAILELFLRNPQKVLSATFILDRVWNSADSPGEEAVRTHIKELRRTLTAAGAPKDFIKTVHRVGYQLNPLYFDFLAPQVEQEPSVPQFAKLKSVNQELRAALGELRSHLDEKGRREQVQKRPHQKDWTLADDPQTLKNGHYYQALIQAAPVIIFQCDVAGQCIYVNECWSRFTGRPAEAAMGTQWLQTLHPDDQKPTISAWNQWLQTKPPKLPFCNEARLVHPDGNLLWVYCTVLPQIGEEGSLVGYVGSLTDVTENKRLEAQFHKAQQIESLSRLVGGIAHNINNILTPVMAITQIMHRKSSNLDARSQAMLQVLESSIKRGRDMIKQILTFVGKNIEAGVAVDLMPLLEDVLDNIRQHFPNSIEIRQDFSDPENPNQNLGTVSANPTRLRQLLLNLCRNAQEAMPTGGILTLSAQNVSVDESMARANLDAQVGQYVVITVADTGSGISHKIQERMFDPFFTTKENKENSGLGLAVVLGIVKRYKGFLQVSSEVGQGTQIKVYLPTLAKTSRLERDTSGE